MRHLKRRSKLGRKTGHRVAMLRNLAMAVIEHGRVRTTLPRAKEVRRVVEHLITLGKRETLHARRQALAIIPNRTLVARVFDEMAARFADRGGGYTRIYRLDYRRGDGAPMALLEVLPTVEEPERREAPPVKTGVRGVMDRLRGRRAAGREKGQPTPEEPQPVRPAEDRGPQEETEPSPPAGEAAASAPEEGAVPREQSGPAESSAPTGESAEDTSKT